MKLWCHFPKQLIAWNLFVLAGLSLGSNNYKMFLPNTYCFNSI